MVSMRAKPQKTKFQEVIYYASIKLFRYDLCLQPERALFQRRYPRRRKRSQKLHGNVLRELQGARWGHDVQLHRLRLYENRCRLQGAELYLLTTTVNAKPETSISPETAHAAARKPSAAPSAVAAGNKIRKKCENQLLTTRMGECYTAIVWEKESRVSTLTLAQTRDYGPILILSSLCVEIYVQC